MEFWYWLVSWLPFEWAAPDSMLFMKHALLAILVVTPLFGLLSTMVVESRMAFFSDALGHSAFTGMAIGAICGFHEPSLAAVIFAIFFAVLFFVAQIVGKLMKFPKKDAEALSMTTLARNSPLSLAIAVVTFPEQPLISLALVIGPLIELPVLSVISGILKRWNDN